MVVAIVVLGIAGSDPCVVRDVVMRAVHRSLCAVSIRSLVFLPLVAPCTACDPCLILDALGDDCGNLQETCQTDDDCDEGLVCDIEEGDEGGICLVVDDGSG